MSEFAEVCKQEYIFSPCLYNKQALCQCIKKQFTIRTQPAALFFWAVWLWKSLAHTHSSALRSTALQLCGSFRGKQWLLGQRAGHRNRERGGEQSSLRQHTAAVAITQSICWALMTAEVTKNNAFTHFLQHLASKSGRDYIGRILLCTVLFVCVWVCLCLY